MRKFLAALNHGLAACSGFGTYLMGLQRPCVKSKRSSDCDGIPSLEEARKDYQAALRTRSF